MDLLKELPNEVEYEVSQVREKLSVSDVMRVLNVSRNTVNAWIRDGIIKGEQAGDHNTAPWEFAPEEVERVRKQRVQELRDDITRISQSVYEYMEKMRYV